MIEFLLKKNVAYMCDQDGKSPIDYTLEKGDIRSYNEIAKYAIDSFSINASDGLNLVKNFSKDFRSSFTC